MMRFSARTKTGRRSAVSRSSGWVRPEPVPSPAESNGGLRKFTVPEILFGVEALGEIADAVRRLGGRRVLVVTDPGIMAAGWLGEACSHFDRAGVDHRVWHGVTPNPKDHEVAAGFRQYQESGCDVVVAVGGGSCIDAAKGIAILAGNGGQILDYEGVDRVTRPIPPTIMVPTTAGTGADITQFAVITDTNRRLKATIISRTLVPTVSLTDPRLTLTMDTELTAATGIDALSHGIEAYLSKGASFLSDQHALTSIRLVSANLRRAVEYPDDLGVRTMMARASLEAGMAMTTSILGCTHALSHQIGGALDLPHGLLNGVLLPHVMLFNAAAVPDRFFAIADALGLEQVRGSGMDAAEMAAEAVRSLADDVGIPKGLSLLGLSSADADLFVDTTLRDANIMTNPRSVTREDVAELFEAAL